MPTLVSGAATAAGKTEITQPLNLTEIRNAS